VKDHTLSTPVRKGRVAWGVRYSRGGFNFRDEGKKGPRRRVTRGEGNRT
jgi:hypothetical protein